MEPPVDLLLGIESCNFVSQVPGPAVGVLEAQETLPPGVLASELRAETMDSRLCRRDCEAGALMVSTTVQGRRRLTPQVSRQGEGGGRGGQKVGCKSVGKREEERGEGERRRRGRKRGRERVRGRECGGRGRGEGEGQELGGGDREGH